MQINSVNNVSFKGVRIFDNANQARKMINSGRDEIVNLAKHKLSQEPKFLVATGEDASWVREAARIPEKAAEIYKALMSKAERTGTGKYTDVI